MDLRNKTLIHFKQCENPKCRFRFPAPMTNRPSENCPVCGFNTRIENQTSASAKNQNIQQPATSIRIEALLDNLRSGYNVGSIFRTADGSGINHIHLAGISSTPNHSKVAKTALGAQNNVPWSYNLNGLDVLKDLKKRGYRIWAIENNVSSKSLFDVKMPVKNESPLLIIVGNEIAGVDPGMLNQCDLILSIPMLGKKRSLNVVVAFGVVVYYLRYVASALIE